MRRRVGGSVAAVHRLSGGGGTLFGGADFFLAEVAESRGEGGCHRSINNSALRSHNKHLTRCNSLISHQHHPLIYESL